jgi:hypothetical protein
MFFDNLEKENLRLMSKYVLKELSNLVRENVISEDVAIKIKDYYSQQKKESTRLITVFAVLGALLTGLGVILIIAHNWDDLHKVAKLILAFTPLVIAQLLCVYQFPAKANATSSGWREASSTLLFFAVGASISLVSQVYHIEGDLSRFLLVWMLLVIPLIYILNSRMACLLAVAGITWYGLLEGYTPRFLGFDVDPEAPWIYWTLLAAIIPYVYSVFRSENRIFFYVISWLVVLSVTVCLGTFGRNDEDWLPMAYASFFGFLVIFGDGLASAPIIGNAYRVTGRTGSIVLMLLFSFGEMWHGIAEHSNTLGREFLVATISTFVALIALVVRRSQNPALIRDPLTYVFIFFSAIYFMGVSNQDVGVVLVNLTLLFTSVLITKNGADEDNLLALNSGLAILATLVVCRFFDTDLTFVVRGLLFVAVGLSFFGANYWIIKRRKLKQA